VHRLLSALCAAAVLTAAPAGAQSPPAEHQIYGIVTRVGTNSIVLKRHDGRLETIDIEPARVADATGVLYVNRPVAVIGTIDAAGRYHAAEIRSWYGLLRGVWPADR
jgi:hypothetical protein